MKQRPQKYAFLDGEGDAWLRRNRHVGETESDENHYIDDITERIESLPLQDGQNITLCEVGCGQGERLKYLKKRRGWNTVGLDPSVDAISEISSAGLDGHVGTADSLPFRDRSVDILVYGFCLYLCDREDLFRIAAEADRVLKQESWLVIIDFWSRSQQAVPYHHLTGVYSYKDNLPGMFCWHPYYTITDHYMREHSAGGYTDNKDEWVSSTIIRRHTYNQDS